MKKLSMLSVMAITLCVATYAGHISPGGSNIVVGPQGKLFSYIPSMESDKNGQLVPEAHPSSKDWSLKAHSSQFPNIVSGEVRNNGLSYYVRSNPNQLDTESIENNRATLSCKEDSVTIQAVSVL